MLLTFFFPFALSFYHVLSASYSVFTASLGCHPLCSPLLLRELPEGGGAVKAVVMLGLFNKDKTCHCITNDL